MEEGLQAETLMNLKEVRQPTINMNFPGYAAPWQPRHLCQLELLVIGSDNCFFSR